MKTHYSAAELASMGIPGLPATKANVIAMANRESWARRPREGRGGGFEYPVAALPPKAQRALAQREIGAVALAPFELPRIDDLRAGQLSALQARIALLAEIDRLVQSGGLSRAKAVEALVTSARSRKLPSHLQALISAANARAGKEGKRTLCRATLFNWLKARDASGDARAIAPKAGPEAAIPPWADTLLRLWGRPTKPNLTDVLEAWPQGEVAPSYSQARRFMKRVDPITRNTGRLGPRALKSMKAYIVRDVSKLWPGAVYVGDGHTFKAEVAHPIHGRPFRPEVTAILDVFTRRWVGWSVDLAENTWAVADALRHAFTTASCCDIFYYDNGSGANNEAWDGPVAGLTGRLGIMKLNSAPWSSQARGVIERFHSTVLHKLARELPTYVGARMDKEARQRAFKITRQEIRTVGASRMLVDWPEFMRRVDEAQAAYNSRPHSTLPKCLDALTGKRRNMTPDESWNGAIAAGWGPQALTEEEGRDLFRPALMRTVQRATVRLFNNIYFHPVLENLHGETVVVGYDIHDPAKVKINLPDGRWVCDAECDGNKRDYVPISFAEKARTKRIEGRLARLETHRQEALAEGGAAVIEHSFRAPEPLPISDREADYAARLEADLPAEPVLSDADRQHREKIQRFRRAKAIQAQIAEGDSFAAEDVRWFLAYQRMPEFTSLSMIYDDFGEAALEF